MIDYDEHARAWLAGTLKPTDRDDWNAQAKAEAVMVRMLLSGYGVNTLLEVGSGVGRMTRHLAEHFEKVIAIDASPGMVECTLLACADLTNVQVIDQYAHEPYPVADAALIYDVLDPDWTIEQADDLVSAVLRSCMIVLVARVRLEDWTPWQGQIAAEGSDWWLLQGATL